MRFKKLKAEIEELEDKLTTNEDLQETIQNEQKEIINEMKKIGIERLPYSYSSLGRFIDPKTMNVHYNKHYKGYVEKLNAALANLKGADAELEEIVKGISRYNKTVKNNAGGAFNHALFWKMLSPKKQTINGPVEEKIKKDFGSYEEFKKQFTEKAQKNFGSGWCWLVLTKRGTLKIMTTANQDNPLMDVVDQGGYPILGLDLWEHAYYLKYRNRKEEYIKNFWRVVNWDYVESELSRKLDKTVKESTTAKEFLTEAVKSEPCSTQDKMASKLLFNTNRDVLNLYKNAIMQILKDTFADRYYNKDEYEKGQMSGVYNLEGKGRSVINYLNTNYSAFCVLKKDINKYLTKVGEEPIIFSDKTPKEQVIEMARMLKVLNKVKFRVFSLESETFKTIMSVMGVTSDKGNKTEDAVVEKLKKQFGDENVTRIGELGNKEDMMTGVDVKIMVDGVEKTAQVKPFSYITKSDDMYKVDGTANVKKYQTNDGAPSCKYRS